MRRTIGKAVLARGTPERFAPFIADEIAKSIDIIREVDRPFEG